MEKLELQEKFLKEVLIFQKNSRKLESIESNVIVKLGRGEIEARVLDKFIDTLIRYIQVSEKNILKSKETVNKLRVFLTDEQQKPVLGILREQENILKMSREKLEIYNDALFTMNYGTNLNVDDLLKRINQN